MNKGSNRINHTINKLKDNILEIDGFLNEIQNKPKQPKKKNNTDLSFKLESLIRDLKYKMKK